jgi:hypothetical protein
MKASLIPGNRRAVIAAFAAMALSAAATAADRGEVRVTADKEVAARTNMSVDPRDSSALKTSFDKDVAARTNMKRDPGDVGGVHTSPDMAVRERTNMGGIAVRKDAQPATSTAGR